MSIEENNVSEAELIYRKRFDLMLIHAAICGLTYITPGEHLPSFIFDSTTEEETQFKVNAYSRIHKLWSQVAFVGRKN